jgi:16S rRNA (guanine(527)-N(7))-methyltransferase RsmG
MREQLTQAIRTHELTFGINVSEAAAERLADYYYLIQEHNPVLHLVGPSSPEEFAIRHVLESLTLLRHLPLGAKLADIGTGAGLPSIPCLLARDDIRAILIESKLKKTQFLGDAIKALDLNGRAIVIDRQFEETTPADAEFVTCRALDKFSEKLPRIVKWSGPRTMLLFGGNNLRETLQKLRLSFTNELMPMSEARFLYVIHPAKNPNL